MKTASLKEAAKKFRADLVGIASIEKFKDLKPERNPLSIFPECKSVIILGRRILRGALRGIEEGTNFGSTYGAFGHGWLEDNFLSKTTYDVTCWIEENGFEAVPMFGYDKDVNMGYGTPVAEGKPAPNVTLDMQYAAHAAGLGEIGSGGFFLTPEFGPRQRFAAILTDAELDCDSIQAGNLCDGCDACLKACPLNAYSTETEQAGVAESSCSVNKLNLDICKACANGAASRGGQGGSVDRLAASCARACVAQLDKDNKLSNKFNQPFRKRVPWALDPLKQPIKDSAVHRTI